MSTLSKPWAPLVLGVLLAACLAPEVTAGKTDPAGQADKERGAPDPVAEIDGQPISWSDLEASISGELRQIETQRQHVIETGLDALIQQRLIEAEAKRRGLSADDLMAAEVTAKTAPVTDADIDAWYTENQARVRQPKEKVAEQIRAFLEQQRHQKALGEWVASLRERFEVVSHLEPLRVELDTSGAPVRGPADAPVTLVEFSDFECPYCRGINPALDELRERYGDKLRLVFRLFPLRQIHPQAQKAAEAALCAREQGQFWQMHDAMFADQNKLAVEDLEHTAGDLGLDAERFDRCLDGGKTAAAVQADLDAGQRVGVGGTPSIFVNGRPVQLVGGRPMADQIAEVIDDELRRTGAATAASSAKPSVKSM